MVLARLEISLAPASGFAPLVCNYAQEKTVHKLPSCNSKIAIATLISVGLTWSITAWADVDVEAAKALARQNNCFKCHSMEKEKDGPAYKKVAEKFKGKEGAEARLIEHITTGENAKFPDGHEEAHKIVKTSPPNDMAQIKNLVDWILSL